MRTDQSSTLHYGERIFHTVFASEREVPYNPIFAEAAHRSMSPDDEWTAPRSPRLLA
jgi:hypothetical protein